MPLPAFPKTNSLSDDSVSNLVGASQDFVVQGYIRTLPDSRFFVLDPVVISFLKVVEDIYLALHR